MLSEIYTNRASKHCTDVVYLDLRKAFDSVCHPILIKKLQTFGVTGALLNLFMNYIYGRLQQVSIGGSLSGTLPVNSGIPQGSILGPLLFLVYINDMPDAVSLSSILLLADDTKCLRSVPYSDHFSTACASVGLGIVVLLPYLINDIVVLERVQRRATKFIINDFTSDYKTRLRSLNLLPLMMTFEFQDLIFFINTIQTPDPSLNILDYVSNSTNTTRSGAGLKLRHSVSFTNLDHHFYYNRLPRLWNSLPVIQDSLSPNAVTVIIKTTSGPHSNLY
uniref:Reverse transcriptase domain-containing protein n=1 Tax=Amphimedon queenslandica TaxID=400682 RepID=A0A1X7V1D5_AMPQE